MATREATIHQEIMALTTGAVAIAMTVGTGSAMDTGKDMGTSRAAATVHLDLATGVLVVKMTSLGTNLVAMVMVGTAVATTTDDAMTVGTRPDAECLGFKAADYFLGAQVDVG